MLYKQQREEKARCVAKRQKKLNIDDIACVIYHIMHIFHHGEDVYMIYVIENILF